MTTQQRQDADTYLAALCLGYDPAALVRALQAARAELTVLHIAPPADWRTVRVAAEVELKALVE